MYVIYEAALEMCNPEKLTAKKWEKCLNFQAKQHF